MKIYLVLYVLGQAVFSLGPWSQGSDELCKAAATSLQVSARNHTQEFEKVTGKTVKPEDITGDCIKSETTPYIKDAIRMN